MVIGSKREGHADRGCFLADDQVDGRLHLVLVVAALDLLLDAPNPQHGPVQSDELRMRGRESPVTITAAYAVAAS